MRRALGGAMAALLVAAAIPAAAAPGAGAGVEQDAMAMWIQMRGSTGTLYAADGRRTVDGSGSRTLGGVARGKCTKRKTAHFTIIECFALGRMKELGAADFQMDPALRTASLRVELGGLSHTVEWESKETPSFGQGAELGEWGVGVGAGGRARAKATGTVFGKKLGKGCTFCYLMEAGGAGVSTSMARHLDIERRADHFTVELRLKKRT